VAADPLPSKLQRLKDTLAARGLSPRKMFGQNFMVDTNFAAAIAREAKLDRGSLAIEVGPGTGLLTEALLASHPEARVLAIEIDRGLAELLRESFAVEISSGRLTLLEGDALDGKHRLNPQLAAHIRELKQREQRARAVLCSNLPYNAGTPIVAIAATDADDTGIADALVTVQLELAERMLATAGSDAYGGLSALIALRATGKIERVIGAEVFWPRPQVDSALLRLKFLPWDLHHDPTAAAPLAKAEVPEFQAFLQQIFSQRRKTLRSVLRPRILPPEFAACGDRRAENIAPTQLLAIFRALA